LTGFGVALGIVMFLAGIAALTAAFIGARRRPNWNWRFGPARWLGTLGTALLLGGLINVVIALQ
jgi:hypothetical protein